jgi:hypothetical protein
MINLPVARGLNITTSTVKMLERTPTSFLGCCLHGRVKWVVSEGMPLGKGGLVEVVWSEMAEVEDGRLSRKDPMVRGDIQCV